MGSKLDPIDSLFHPSLCRSQKPPLHSAFSPIRHDSPSVCSHPPMRSPSFASVVLLLYLPSSSFSLPPCLAPQLGDRSRRRLAHGGGYSPAAVPPATLPQPAGVTTHRGPMAAPRAISSMAEAVPGGCHLKAIRCSSLRGGGGELGTIETLTYGSN